MHLNQPFIDKFNYLKAQLKGTASEVISGLELSQENYNITINLLKERYRKKEIMIKAHFAKLINLPMAAYKTLRAFYDTMEKHLRCLQLLGEEDTSALESNEDTESGMIGEKVIMQTALMTIKGNDSILTTRALFDTGSRRSYVMEEVAISLKLKPIEEQAFLIYAFGDSKPKQKKRL